MLPSALSGMFFHGHVTRVLEDVPPHEPGKPPECGHGDEAPGFGALVGAPDG